MSTKTNNKKNKIIKTQSAISKNKKGKNKRTPLHPTPACLPRAIFTTTASSSSSSLESKRDQTNKGVRGSG
jgi:hypothetical protein